MQRRRRISKTRSRAASLFLAVFVIYTLIHAYVKYLWQILAVLLDKRVY